MKTFINKEDGDSDSDDEDIEVQGTKQNYKDPITAGWLVKPVRRYVVPRSPSSYCSPQY
jgi:hypothetical protein